MSSVPDIIIAKQIIKAGQHKQINARVAKLPTRTSIEIPIIVNRSKQPGPIILLMGGMHGDEINGIEIIRRIVAKNFDKPKIGTVISIPLLNIYGFLLFSREVPDGKDINRAFPGSKNGSLASQIAYLLRTDILPIIDFGIDFHTGGSRINNYPQIRTQLDHPFGLELAMAFGARFTLNANLREKSFRKEAEKVDKPILVFEGGESLRLRKSAIDAGVNGALRVMKHMGMTDVEAGARNEQIIIKESTWVRSRAAGLYHSYARIGEKVTKGMVLGLITGPFGQFEIPIKSNLNGYVIAINNNPVINKGDALLHIGIPVD